MWLPYPIAQEAVLRIILCLFVVTCLACSGPQSSGSEGIQGLDAWEGLLYRDVGPNGPPEEPTEAPVMLWVVETGERFVVGTTVVKNLDDMLERQAVIVRGTEIEQGKIAASVIESRPPYESTVEGFLKPPGLGFDDGAPGYRVYGGSAGDQAEFDLGVGGPVNANILDELVQRGAYVKATFQTRVATAFYESGGTQMVLTSELQTIESIPTPEGLLRAEGILVKLPDGSHTLFVYDGQTIAVAANNVVSEWEYAPTIAVGSVDEAGLFTVTDLASAPTPEQVLEGILEKKGDVYSVGGTPLRFSPDVDVALLEAMEGIQVQAPAERVVNVEVEPFALEWLARSLTSAESP